MIFDEREGGIEVLERPTFSSQDATEDTDVMPLFTGQQVSTMTNRFSTAESGKGTSLIKEKDAGEDGNQGHHNELQERALAAYTELQTDPSAEFILGAYAQALEAVDESFPGVEQALSSLQGANLIPEVARANLSKQLNFYLLAAYDMVRYNTATASSFGKYKTFNGRETSGNPLDPIEVEIWRIYNDFKKIAEFPPTFEAFRTHTLPIMDKYLFDTRRVEDNSTFPLNTLVIEDSSLSRGEELLTNELQREGILPREPVTNFEMNGQYDFATSTVARADINYLTVFKNSSVVIKRGSPVPDVIIVPISSDIEEFMKKNDEYQLLLTQSYRVPPNDRPSIVFYSPDGEEIPLFIKAHLEDNLFCSGIDELRSAVSLTKALQLAKKQLPLVEPAVLSQLQERQYDESTDLREWEHETADTYQALKYLVTRLNERSEAWFRRYRPKFKIGRSTSTPKVPELIKIEDEEEDLDTQSKSTPYLTESVLDIATGDGRIGGMLARLGYKVVGIDISQEQLNRGKQRLIEEGEGLRDERDDPKLSYNVLKRLKTEGILGKQGIIEDDQVTQDNYVTAKGDFLNLNNTLRKLAISWYKEHPNLRRDRFMDVETIEPLYGDPLYTVAFDAAIMNWHSFNEIGDPEDRRVFLSQVFGALKAGSEFTIEIPDRTVDPYASTVKQYYENHPDIPYGTHREQSETGEEYTPRYFPGRNEMVLMLQAVGFEIDPEEDIKTYLVTKTDQTTQQEQLKVKELVIRARKPTK